MSLQILRKGENEMAKKEVKTDLWVARQLDDSKIKYDAQGSDVKEINDALQSASTVSYTHLDVYKRQALLQRRSVQSDLCGAGGLYRR